MAMELVKADNFTAPFEGMMNLPVARQLVLMFGLAASVALMVAIVLWSQKPNYNVLYGSLDSKDASEVMQALQGEGIDYKLDETTGALMVPSSKVHEVRLKLANQGLPKGTAIGLDILQQKQEFGTSQFMESARYQHALEGELARSIMTINSVENARVHLAMPRQSAFVRKRQKPSASVLVNLYRGRTLEEEQVAAITHMVASGIPNLEPERVTVVDQKGRLLSRKQQTAEIAQSEEHFEHTRRVEENYIRRIEEILAPIVGMDGVRAQVSAELDFTVTEQTQETYNPDLPALRSEQTYEEQTLGQDASGVPGAMSNQPPGKVTVPETGLESGMMGEQAASPIKSTRRATANYELDRTISHSKLSGGSVKRLSVAVVVDNKQAVNDEGQLVSEPRSAEELERITTLVREAVGYSAQRGDTVNVINAAFAEAEEVAPLPEPPLWEQPWVWDAGKQLLGVFVALLLALGLVRPLLKQVATVKPPRPALPKEDEDQVTLGGPSKITALPKPGEDANVELIKQMAQQDPKQVAQVVKSWVAAD